MESTLSQKSRASPSASDESGKAPKAGSEEERRRREAEGLRQNLLRRKAQQRSRQSPPKSPGKP